MTGKACDHSFVDSTVCLKCGKPFVELQAELDADAQALLAEARGDTYGPRSGGAPTRKDGGSASGTNVGDAEPPDQPTSDL